jgi:hypothetical protein
LLTVEQLDERAARILTREMGEDDSCDVGVLNPLVYEADASVVDCYDGIIAA